MCPVPFNSARAFVSLGSRLVEGTKYVCRQGLLRIDLLLTAVGVENRGIISSGALFYNGRHVTPSVCWCSVKQDHQFLNKISTYISYPTYPPWQKFCCYFQYFKGHSLFIVVCYYRSLYFWKFTYKYDLPVSTRPRKLGEREEGERQNFLWSPSQSHSSPKFIDNAPVSQPDISSACLFYLFNKQNLYVSLIFLAGTNS